MTIGNVPSERRKIGVIALVPDIWNGVWMPRHHVMGRLARHFEVVWIEPPGAWRDYWLPGGAEEPVFQTLAPESFGIRLYRPGRWLPEVYRPQSLAGWIRRRRVARAASRLRRMGCTQVVLYLWRPEFDWALGGVEVDLTCYHIDDEYRFSSEDLPNDPREVALIERVDQVFIHSRRLLEKKGGINPHTMHVPNGVDYVAYAAPAPEPADLAAVPRPRMGYVGVIKSQLDFELLHALARRRPDWSFVLVGPEGHLAGKATQYAGLTALPNVYALGNRQLDELPGYMQAMDVCMMCYEVCDYTHFIYPLKLNEYLATGRPVVCSPIDAALPLAGTIGIAAGEDQWHDCLESALGVEANALSAVARRRARAATHDWDRLVDGIARQIGRRLDEKGAGGERSSRDVGDGDRWTALPRADGETALRAGHPGVRAVPVDRAARNR